MYIDGRALDNRVVCASCMVLDLVSSMSYFVRGFFSYYHSEVASTL